MHGHEACHVAGHGTHVMKFTDSYPTLWALWWVAAGCVALVIGVIGFIFVVATAYW